MKQLEKWIKIHNNKIIEIDVISFDWGYQARVNKKPITTMEVRLEDIHEVLFGNGCRQSEKNMEIEKKTDIPEFKKIKWDIITKWVFNN